jgi:hypothetical protein
MSGLYYSIWRDNILRSLDILDIYQELKEREFPFRLRLPAQINEFKYLPPNQRKLSVGIVVTDLPPYIFEKYLRTTTANSSTHPRPKGLIEKLFISPNPTIPSKFSRYDNTVLLGAIKQDQLIELVIGCGFKLQNSMEDIFIHLGI